MTSLPNLRAAIMKAVPDKEWVVEYDNLNGFGTYKAPITLADVLRAIKNPRISVLATGEIVGADVVTGGSAIYAIWDLTKNLDDQSPETIAFLTSVLCNE